MQSVDTGAIGSAGYKRRLNSVELNNAFYRLPKRDVRPARDYPTY